MYPDANLYLVGFSLGASVGMKYLASDHGKKNIKGMVTVSNPWDVYKSACYLNTWKNFVYGKFLVNKLFEKAYFNREMIDKLNLNIDWKRLKKCLTTFEFDEHFTLKLKPDGIDSISYYQHMSCVNYIETI